MKRIVLLLLVLSGTAGAQAISALKVPSAVKSSFIKNHPGLKVSWEKEGGNYEAGFTLNGTETSEIYTTAGVLTESETAIKVEALPASVLQYIRLHYKNTSIKEAAKITSTKGEITYEALVKGKDLMFDSKGNFLK